MMKNDFNHHSIGMHLLFKYNNNIRDNCSPSTYNYMDEQTRLNIASDISVDDYSNGLLLILYEK